MKLTVNEKSRLFELALANGRIGYSSNTHAGTMKATNERLVQKGLAEYVGRKVAKTGRLVFAGHARITDAGRAALKEDAA